MNIHKLHTISISIALIGLLFPVNISSLCVIIFALASILKIVLTRKKLKKPTKEVVVFTGLYFLYLFGLLYTTNIKNAQGLLERNIIWLLAPLLIYFTVNLTNKQRYSVLLSFVVTTQLFALIYLLNAAKNFFITKDTASFYYEELTRPFTDFHPVYFAMYLLFSIVIIFYAHKNKIIQLSKIPLALLIFFNIVMLILVSSKSVLLLFLVFCVYEIGKTISFSKRIIAIPLLIISFVVVIFSFSTTRERINESLLSDWSILKKDKFLYNDAFSGVTLRLITWKFVVQKMFHQENVLIGVGTGDGQDFIDSTYKDLHMDKAGYLSFNMHNQYLEYFVRFGLIGMLYFFTILFFLYKKAIRNKDAVFIWFLIIICFVSLTESTLEVHRGIVYFTLFASLLYFNSYATPKNVVE